MGVVIVFFFYYIFSLINETESLKFQIYSKILKLNQMTNKVLIYICIYIQNLQFTVLYIDFFFFTHQNETQRRTNRFNCIYYVRAKEVKII